MVGVLKYSDKIIVETFHKTDTGIYVKGTEISNISNSSTTLEIGEVILKHLNLIKSGISYNNFEHKKSADNFKKITGLKTNKALMKDSIYIEVTLKDGLLTLLPTINDGTSGYHKGFTPKSEYEKKLENVHAEELGVAVNDLWQHCL